MTQVEINDFMGSAYCHSQSYSSREGFLPITYQFLSGNVYGLISDFGRGSWGLTTCLGGKCETVIKGTVAVDRQTVNCNELRRYTCFVGERMINDIDPEQIGLSASKCIKRALEISKLPFTVDQIKEMFELSDERFDRDLNMVSGEIYRISIAIGFAFNKDIFCYPWMNTHDLSRYVDKKCIEVLRKYKKIVLIPACRAVLNSPYKTMFDSIINFHSYKANYYQLGPEERKRMKKLKWL